MCKTIAIIIVSFLFFLPQLCFSQSSDVKPRTIDELLLFYPAKFPAGDWNPQDLLFQDVYFASEDKTKLHGWYCPCDNSRAVLLLAHGNAGNVATRATWLRYLQRQAKLTVFTFDYRGYVSSTCTYTAEHLLFHARCG